MTSQRPWNLFALLDDSETPILRLPLTRDLQNTVGNTFQGQLGELFANEPDEVPFDASLNPDESEIAYISGFEPPAIIWEAIRNPTRLDSYEASQETLEKTKGFFTGDHLSRKLLFQVFDRRRVLSTQRVTILYSGDTFRRLEDPGVTLDTQLAAGFMDDRLYFRSFYTARRLFDLSPYFREATDRELETFAGHQALAVPDADELREQADTWVRKKIALILQSGILDSQPPTKIAQVAKAYGVPVTFDGKRIAIPSDKRALKQVLRLLEENFFTSELTATGISLTRRGGCSGAAQPRHSAPVSAPAEAGPEPKKPPKPSSKLAGSGG